MIRAGAQRSAKSAVPLILRWVRPQTIIDVGCGQGTWLAEFRAQGVANVCGIDGDYVERDKLEIPQERFAAFDLKRSFAVDRRFDLAMSLEVAEHLPASVAGGFIASLVRLAPIVLFSAAVPYQGGMNHVNEQWPDYWARLFAQHDYLPIDCLRRELWSRPEVEWWYAQNMFFYAQRTYLESQPALLAAHQQCPTALSLVHPQRYTLLVDHIVQARRAQQQPKPAG